MRLNPKQSAALDFLEDSMTSELFYGGAAGGGKSILISYWLLKNCIRYPGSRWLLGRKLLKVLKQTTLLSFFKVAKMQGCESAYTYHEQKGEIKFANGSVIFLKQLFYKPSDPEVDELGSLEITGAAIDEVPEVDEKVFEIIKSRCRHDLDRFGLIPKILVCGNPRKNWTHRYFWKRFKDGCLPDYVQFIRALVTDNPDISPHYIAQLEKMKGSLRERLLLGNFDYDDDENALFDFDAVNDLFSNIHIEEGDDWYLTCDVALQGSDDFVLGAWKGMVLKKVRQFPKLNGKEAVDKIAEIKREFGVRNSNIVFDADGVGGYIGGFFPGAIEFHNGAKPHGGDNYRNLKSQCFYTLAELVSTGKIFIADTSSWLPDRVTEELGAIKKYKADSDGKLMVEPKEVVRRALGHSPDVADMLAMRMYFVKKPSGGMLAFG